MTGGTKTGGLVGYNELSSITECVATGNITATDRYTGGLVGNSYNQSIISESYATGSVNGQTDTGGLVGQHYSFSFTEENLKSSIKNCYSTGAVSGTYYVGGLTGGVHYSSISNSYSLGSVAGTSNTGAFIGFYGSAISIEPCFYNYETSTVSTGTNDGNKVGITGNPTILMQNESTFTNAGWDFSTVWEMDTYPVLQAFSTSDVLIVAELGEIDPGTGTLIKN